MGNQNRIHYRHFVDQGITYAYRIVKEEGDTIEVEAAEAYVHPRDQFSRKIGRRVAGGRLNCPRTDISHRRRFKFNMKSPASANEWRRIENELYKFPFDQYQYIDPENVLIDKE